MAHKSVKYVAELPHVREVSLRGGADLAYWTRFLAEENLIPLERNGCAQILIIAVNMKYNGIRFTEFSVSAEVDMAGMQSWPNAAFLIHAYTTSRIFAFFERTFFRTPYHYGDCQISTADAVSIQLSNKSQQLFRAEMGRMPISESRTQTQYEFDSWEGPIFIPTKGRADSENGHVFFGRLKGRTTKCPFRNQIDTFSIVPAPGFEILQSLFDSGFAAEEWIVRDDATHARSKTYKRTSILAR